MLVCRICHNCTDTIHGQARIDQAVVVRREKEKGGKSSVGSGSALNIRVRVVLTIYGNLTAELGTLY
jgi:hypothetical protein